MLDAFGQKSRNIKTRNFTVGTEVMLHNLHADEYIPMFRKYDLGGKELNDLVAEDLIIMGIDSPALRQTIIDNCCEKQRPDTYAADDAAQLLTNINQQLQRINLAIVTNNCSMINDPDPQDALVFPHLFASTVMLQAIDSIEEKLDTMSDALSHTILKETNKLSKRHKGKQKIVTATVGGALIVALSYYLVKSLGN